RIDRREPAIRHAALRADIQQVSDGRASRRGEDRVAAARRSARDLGETEVRAAIPHEVEAPPHPHARAPATARLHRQTPAREGIPELARVDLEGQPAPADGLT